MPHTLKGKTLLIVDDDAMMCEFVVACFASADVHVVTAGSLAEADTLLANGQPPDLALIDMGLGDGRGSDLIPLLNRLGVRAAIYTADPKRLTLRDINTDVWSKMEITGLALISRVIELLNGSVPRADVCPKRRW